MLWTAIKICRSIQVLLKSDTNIRHFTWRPLW